ncbi:NUDIX hydrolase [Variovorax saccharolyticus]|uniref:NUDIX hydrolase n=1 Tax=Variovorax saccharolyticus TaxID=3053516 RepID=UPI002574E747|nr:NUDIX domain-containing protein [Variovorax sp. J31P216]MDM0023923.1 NUDIX domain-containing protein [Variovorax sp. J31P216]
MNPASTSLSPAPTRPIRFAATLIVLRDGADGLEVLMLRRAEKEGDQNSGASVFPGGGVDPRDRLLHPRCAGLDDATASRRLALPAAGLDFYAAAIRECFEEAGLLFASGGDGLPVTLDHLADDQISALRATTEEGAESLLGLCVERGWRLAADRLTYFAHWLTPPGMPRRFDTRFFVALAPAGQQARPDGRETVEHFWLRPAEALAPARGLRLMNVQRRVLQQLDAFDSAEACLAHARALQQIPLVMPRRALASDGLRAVNPGEPAYAEIARIDPEGEGHARCELADGLAMFLSPRVLRVTARRAGALVNGYLVGGERNEWALIDLDAGDERHRSMLMASAPGPVRWVLSLREPPSVAGEGIDLGGCRLRRLEQGFLLEEERMLFAAEADSMPAPAGIEVEWLALRSGFLLRA